MLTIIIIVLLVLLLTGWFGYSRRGRRTRRPRNARITVGRPTVILRAPPLSACRRSSRRLLRKLPIAPASVAITVIA